MENEPDPFFLDIRLNFIERARAAARLPLARAMLSALIDNPEVRQSERAFREFMKAINFNAAGQTFEALRPDQVARLIDSCLDKAAEGKESCRGKGGKGDAGN